MADIGAILKALANWQPTGPISRDQLAQDFGRSSRFATFDSKPQQGVQYAGQGPGGGGQGSGIDLMAQQRVEPPQSVGQLPMVPDIEQGAEVQPFNPQALPEGQALPDPALMAALKQDPTGVVGVGGMGGGQLEGQPPMSFEVPQYSSEGYNLMPEGDFGMGGNMVGGGTAAASHMFNDPFRQFSNLNPNLRRDGGEEDMMRRSREYQDMVLELLARSRGNG